MNQLAVAVVGWAVTQGAAWINSHFTPEQRDKHLPRIAAMASAIGGIIVSFGAIADAVHRNAVDQALLAVAATAVVNAAQVFGITQLIHHARKVGDKAIKAFSS